jgi:hypothetical protein
MLRTQMLVAVLMFAGCGSDVGTDGASVGGSCEVSSECTPSSVCRNGEDFPGGYCALGCDTDDECPSGSRCVEAEGGICMVDCEGGTGGCRAEEGYTCEELEARGADGHAHVCAIATE